MGGVKDAIFGKPSSSTQDSWSKNRAWTEIKTAFEPALKYTTNAGDTAWNLLKGGPQGFADSGGMKFLMDSMAKGVTSTKAAQGLLKSGSYGTALQDRAMGLGSTYLNQYMDQLFKLGNLGLGAGGVLSSTGQWSKGEGQSTGGKQGIGSMLAQGIGAAIGASDRRLKENIVSLGNGLYEFEYKQDAPIVLPKGRFVGYMADEVPAAYVVDYHGFKGVKAPYLPRKVN